MTEIPSCSSHKATSNAQIHHGDRRRHLRGADWWDLESIIAGTVDGGSERVERLIRVPRKCLVNLAEHAVPASHGRKVKQCSDKRLNSRNKPLILIILVA